MRFRVRALSWRLLLAAGVVLIALAAAAFVRSQPEATRCLLVAWSGLEQIEPGVYVEPFSAREDRALLRREILQARIRVEGFLGSRRGSPVVIAGSAALFQRFGSSLGRTAVTHATPFGDYIVAGPPGINADVLSHEMTHAELKTRVGFFRWRFSIPKWFDEGMAMHVDYRANYDEIHYQETTQGGRLAPKLEEIDTPSKFTARSYVAYLTAKHEFDAWYARAGREGLERLIEDVRAGRPFAEAWRGQR
jgi:hypothetical protein